MPSTYRNSLAGEIPNLLTWLRLIAGLAFPFVPQSWWLALAIYGGLSDLVDGWLSRRLGATSKLGQLLDPIADKIFVLAVAATLVNAGRLTLVELLGIATRDIVVLVISALALGMRKAKTEDLRPRCSGKVATAAQLGLFCWLLVDSGHPTILIGLTILLSCLSAGDYLLAALLINPKSIDDAKSPLHP